MSVWVTRLRRQILLVVIDDARRLHREDAGVHHDLRGVPTGRGQPTHRVRPGNPPGVGDHRQVTDAEIPRRGVGPPVATPVDHHDLGGADPADGRVPGVDSSPLELFLRIADEKDDGTWRGRQCRTTFR
ncbi:hypothetical protein [Nocardioides sp. YIM 152315]|uniref:hypothetical protein n=1 Tax=Nocardioides sp. YIM 152315 TaxID=3031760 RepID=UPI0023D97B28|nr:hypothetical protein [Nocardioides sp. YIM 152315]MDF1604309.1 hypothetical protein [Nocardioides sp. YIM 152315]